MDQSVLNLETETRERKAPFSGGPSKDKESSRYAATNEYEDPLH